MTSSSKAMQSSTEAHGWQDADRAQTPAQPTPAMPDAEARDAQEPTLDALAAIYNRGYTV